MASPRYAPVRGRGGRRQTRTYSGSQDAVDYSSNSNREQGSMVDTSSLDGTYELANILIKRATKDQLAECARLLALNLAHHQIKKGEIPVDETLSLLETAEPTEEHLDVLMEGMLNLIGVLVNVCSDLGHV